jgi:hypothetical protein
MAYIGRSVDIGMFEKQVLTPNSSTTTFTLTFAVGSSNSLLVVYGGVIQEPGVAYSVSGGGQQIAFSEAPVTGTTLYIIYLGKQLTTPRAAGQETTKQSLTGDGVTTLFTLTDPPVVPAGIMVFVDGILQREGAGNNYVSGGSTINFNGAPDNGAEIDVYTLVKEKVSIDTVADGSITRAKMAATFPYWDAAGNFGIGIASPAFKLQVVGTTQLQINAAGTQQVLQLNNNDTTAGTQAVKLGFSSGGVTKASINGAVYGNDYMTFNVGSDTERMRIDSSGNVGIGTSTPDRPVHLKSSGNRNYFRAETTTNSLSNEAGFELKTPSSNFLIGSHGSTNALWVYDVTNTAERLRIDSTGTLIITRASNGVHLSTVVGAENSASLGSFNSAPTIGSNKTGYSGLMFNGASIEPTLDGLNVRQSALVDIGSTNYRFKVGHFTGINFPADRVDSANANTLDDYEEGTWTPTLSKDISASTLTYTTRSAYYTKIGNTVTAWGTITTSGVTTQGSGNNIMTGFPFAAGGATYMCNGIVGQNDVFTATAAKNIWLSSTTAYFNPTTINQANISENWATGARYLTFTITYQVS